MQNCFSFFFLAHRPRTIKVSQTIRRHQHCHLSEHKSQNKTTFQTLAHHWFRYILQYLFSKWSKHATDTASPCLRYRHFEFLFTAWPHLNWSVVCRCLLKKQQHFFVKNNNIFGQGQLFPDKLPIFRKMFTNIRDKRSIWMSKSTKRFYTMPFANYQNTHLFLDIWASLETWNHQKHLNFAIGNCLHFH